MTVPPEDRMSTGLILFLVFYSIAVVCLYSVALMEWDERDRQFHQDEYCEGYKAGAPYNPDITRADIDAVCIEVPTWQDEVWESDG